MERKVGIKRFFQAISELRNPPPISVLIIREAMKVHNVTDSKQLPRSVRSSLAKQFFTYYEFVTGGKYSGDDFPTLNLWFTIGSKLGPDALVDSIKGNLVDTCFLVNERRANTHEEKAQLLQKRIEKMQQAVIENGWRQDQPSEIRQPFEFALIKQK